MPIVTIKPSGKTVTVAEGTTLLDAILSSGEQIQHKCGGKVECGTCHVFVQEGRKGLAKMKPAENAMLDTIVGVGSKSRLACQSILGATDVTVELLGFAS
jgi:2Fe-2S ferredoxin